MLFNSFHFIIFYVVVCAIYFSIPHRARWILLLAASYFFYMSWRPAYIVLIVGSTVVDYLVGRRLAVEADQTKRRLLLMTSVVGNLAVLFYFKYWNFAVDSTHGLAEALGFSIDLPYSSFLLPVGISFYTFQSMSYTIDIYNGKTEAERHFGRFSLYVSFFPQLVAGPIERSSNLLPQFRREVEFSSERLAHGGKQMLWGAFKKIVIADNVATVVGTVYSDPQSYSGPVLVLATVFFAVQIYCDFSGYSDIAIGAARVLGFDLMENFRQPYFASSVTDFWRRWHISLSTWFRDYLFIPLGGSRTRLVLNLRNLFIVFVVSGLWHGAAWTFVVWGAIHGFFVMVERVLLHRLVQAQSNIRRLAMRVYTLSVVLLAWVFFRAESLDDAFQIVRGIAEFRDFAPATLWRLGLPRFEMLVAILSIIFLFAVDFAREAEITRRWRTIANHTAPRVAFYSMLLYGIVFFGNFGDVDFIYFQF